MRIDPNGWAGYLAMAVGMVMLIAIFASVAILLPAGCGINVGATCV